MINKNILQKKRRCRFLYCFNLNYDMVCEFESRRWGYIKKILASSKETVFQRLFLLNMQTDKSEIFR